MAADEPADVEKFKQELRNLFYEREYSRGDAILATGISQKTLEHMTKPRGPLRIVGAMAKQQGRPMKFRGYDILRIEVLRRLQFFGIAHGSFAALNARDAVFKRLDYWLNGLRGPDWLLLYPTPNNSDHREWAVIAHYEGMPEPWTPPEVLVVDCGEIVTEVTAKLRALRDDTEMPRFNPIVEALRQRQSQKYESGQPSDPAASSAAMRTEQVAPQTQTKETKQ